MTLLTVKNADKEIQGNQQTVRITEQNASQWISSMQILTNNVLMYNAINNRFFTSLDMRSEYSRYNLLNVAQN